MNLEYFFKKQSSLQRKFIASSFAAVFSAGAFGSCVGMAMNLNIRDNLAELYLSNLNMGEKQKVEKVEIKVKDLNNYENAFEDGAIVLYIEKNYGYIHKAFFDKHSSVTELLMDLYEIEDESFKTAKYKKPKEEDLIFNFFKYMLKFKGDEKTVELYLTGLLGDIFESEYKFKINLKNTIENQFPDFYGKIEKNFLKKDQSGKGKQKTKKGSKLNDLKKVQRGMNKFKNDLLKNKKISEGTELNPKNEEIVLNNEKKFSFKKLGIAAVIIAAFVIIAVVVIMLLTRGSNNSQQIDTNKGNEQQKGSADSESVIKTEQDPKQGSGFDDVQVPSTTQEFPGNVEKTTGNDSGWNNSTTAAVVAGTAGTLGVGGALIYSANKGGETKSETAEEPKAENKTDAPLVYVGQKDEKVDTKK